MPNRRSIGARLKKAKSIEARREVVRDWAADWRRDQDDIVTQLEQAIQTMDYDELCSATGQLKAVTDKRFQGLSGVLKRLTDDGT